MDEQAFRNRFKALTGFPPFAWQTRLFLDWFSHGRLPEACGVPTGLGKTSVMALWLIARAAGVELPRRLVYVVDRRAVVDQATQFAEKLKEATPEVLGIPDLPVSTLRGQFVDNREWLQNPAAPSIVVGTIDMVGSRLLFSGYGVSRRMRPFHAGLLGTDTLVLLDEAHLCPPFEALLESISNDQRLHAATDESRQLVPPFRLLPLSATSRDESNHVFRLKPDEVDKAHQPLAHQRYRAEKHLSVHELDETASPVATIAERAWCHGVEQGSSRVLVFCDRRTDATKVKDLLDKQLKNEELPQATELLVGARRVRERQALQGWLEEHGFLGDAPQPPETPTFLVATSAGEVGVDLDADHLVCDLVAWERMIQRFGRVNRRGGQARTAKIDVIAVPPKKTAGDEERELYVSRRAVLERLPETGPEGPRNASPAGVERLKQEAEGDSSLRELLLRATTPLPLRPPLTRPVVDAWSLTALDEHAGRPDIEPWLRGWVDDAPQTTVAWRRNLPWRRTARKPLDIDVENHFEAAPIHLEETLETTTSWVIEVLLKRTQETSGYLRGEELEPRLESRPGVIALGPTGQYRGAWTIADLESLGQRKADEQRRDLASWIGATLVVAAELGGLSDAGMLDPKAPPHGSTLDGDWNTDVRQRLGYFPVGPGDTPPDARHWKVVSSLSVASPESNEEGVAPSLRVFVTRGKGTSTAGDQAVAATTQTLPEHHDWVAEEARRIAEEVGLPARYVDMLESAGRAHDLGKARPLWQMAMNAPLADGPYAKTLGGGDGRRLNGYRHEFGSLRDCERQGLFSHLDEELQELAKHLVVAHHGFSRPVITPFDPDAPPHQRDETARAAADRFARLQQTWGPWGLAWWESLLRAADHRASARLNQGGE